MAPDEHVSLECVLGENPNHILIRVRNYPTGRHWLGAMRPNLALILR
ncbi:MAG: hypothetical protein ACI8QS_002338 [Planctomycetota bacterium]|jgi:hypothetical protein